MARSFLTAINLNKNELQNAAVQNLGTAPATPVKGQLYFNSTDNVLYWCQNPVGPVWVAAMDAGGSGFPGYGAPGYPVAETAFGQAKADGVATTVARADHTHGSPVHDDAAHSAVHLNALAAPNGAVTMAGMQITNLGSPVGGNDAVNKNYVDNYIAGLSWKAPVRAVATSAVPLTGTQTVDGVALVAGDRMLAQNQGNTGNGIYVVAAGPWNRATDADTGTELLNAAVFVSEGTVGKDTAWVCTNDAPIIIGTTTPTFVQFAGGGTVTAGAGMTQSGNTLNVVAGDTSLTVAADDIRVNTAVIATVNYVNVSLATYTRKYTVACAAATSTVVNHALNTRNVLVEVARATNPWDTVECDVERTDLNNVTVRFATAPAASDFIITVAG